MGSAESVRSKSAGRWRDPKYPSVYNSLHRPAKCVQKPERQRKPLKMVFVRQKVYMQPYASENNGRYKARNNE